MKRGWLVTDIVLLLALLSGACQAGRVHDLLYERPTDYQEIEQKLAEGANPNSKNHEGRSLLWRAALRGDSLLVRLLLDYGGDPNHQLRASQGETALHAAALKGHDEIVEILLEAGVDVNVASWGGVTPLYRAAHTKQASTVRLLLKRGADPTRRTGDNMTPLHGIGMSGDGSGYLEVVKMLVEAGVPADLEGALGRTPLFDACYAGNEDVVAYLLNQGADPNHQDNHDFSPLMMASLRGEVGCARLLLDVGADPTIKDGNGRTALTIAKEQGNQDIIDLLQSLVD